MNKTFSKPNFVRYFYIVFFQKSKLWLAMSKMIYIMMSGIHALAVIFLQKGFWITLIDSYHPKSEAFVYLIAALLLGLSLYLSYSATKGKDAYWYGCKFIGISWIVILILTRLAIMLMSGPPR